MIEWVGKWAVVLSWCCAVLCWVDGVWWMVDGGWWVGDGRCLGMWLRAWMMRWMGGYQRVHVDVHVDVEAAHRVGSCVGVRRGAFVCCAVLFESSRVEDEDEDEAEGRVQVWGGQGWAA